MSTSKKPATKKASKDSAKPEVHLYTLEVLLIDGRISEEFFEKNPVVSRTIQIRGNQTLEDLHNAIYDAFGRYDEHLYEFQFGKKPMDRNAIRYVIPEAYDQGEDAGPTDITTIGSLGLKVRRSFFYWFDFGDDWWHKIKVAAIEDTVTKGKFPKVIKKVGKNPPQYMNLDD